MMLLVPPICFFLSLGSFCCCCCCCYYYFCHIFLSLFYWDCFSALVVYAFELLLYFYLFFSRHWSLSSLLLHSRWPLFGWVCSYLLFSALTRLCAMKHGILVVCRTEWNEAQMHLLGWLAVFALLWFPFLVLVFTLELWVLFLFFNFLRFPNFFSVFIPFVFVLNSMVIQWWHQRQKMKKKKKAILIHRFSQTLTAYCFLSLVYSHVFLSLCFNLLLTILFTQSWQREMGRHWRGRKLIRT